jgi:diketogulonate reductase-like aldo/keto reductase
MTVTAQAVGVSNYGPELLQRVHDALSARGVPLASNQVQYSLLYRCALQHSTRKYVYHALVLKVIKC